MSHRHKESSHHKELQSRKKWMLSHAKEPPSQHTKRTLEIVLKCDSAGTLEAVTGSIYKSMPPDIQVDIIHSGIGDISMSDIMIAETGSRLIIGYQVNVLTGLVNMLKEQNIEIRLFNLIYALTEDVRKIAESLNPHLPDEQQVIGSARVIALFKSSRKGIIIGCEVLDGHFAQGQNFRIVSAMGPVYSSKIESLQIDRNAVSKATKGQHAGIKIRDFKKVKTGDLVESFRPLTRTKNQAWHPAGEIIRK
jgi:translation initiation factor IF-2